MEENQLTVTRSDEKNNTTVTRTAYSMIDKDKGVAIASNSMEIIRGDPEEVRKLVEEINAAMSGH